MNRRDFLKMMAMAGIATTVELDGAMAMMTQPAKTGAKNSYPDLVAVMGGEPEIMFRKAIAQMGGMKRFVKKGQKVCVKPNIGWDKTPELGANTNPELVREIVKQCIDAGASQVTVFDHTCDDWIKCYKNSGIEEAVESAGGKMMPANLESYYQPVALPKGINMKNAKIHKAILESDLWINVPVLKNHEGAKLTICMKNLMGIVWDRGYMHKHGLQQCIADLSTLPQKAILNVVDAYRIVTQNGPRGRSTADVASSKGLFLSADPVAIDTAAAKFFTQFRSDITVDDADHIAKAQTHKLGTMNLDSLKVRKIKI